MATLFERSTRIRHKRLAAANGVEVVYRRVNDTIDGLVAVPAQVRHNDYGVEATEFSGRERDWLVWVDDLAFAGAKTEPRKNDEIDWIDEDGALHTYQVLPRPDERVFRFTDQTLLQFRVYTVEVIPNAE